MSLITQIMQYLDDEGVGTYDSTGTTGSIFAGDFPSSPDHCIVVRGTGGPQGDMKFPYDIPSIQILVRGSSNPIPAYNKALEVYGLLHNFRGDKLVIDGYHIIEITGIQSSPAEIGRDDNGRYRYSQNYHVQLVNQTEFRL